jgi:hypothetical protein
VFIYDIYISYKLTDIHQRKKMTTQISCAIKASNELVKNLHRDGLDRGCIATFNDYMMVRQVNDISLLIPYYVHDFFFKYVLSIYV